MAEQQHLLGVLHDRDIPLGEDDFAWAFAGSHTRDHAQSFVRDFLQPSTLLTKDELDFSHHHGVQGSDHAASQGRPLTDTELEAAIASLEASTAAIERQSRVLETQKEALQEIKGRNASTTSMSGDGRRKKFARETAELDFEIEELSQDATSRLASASKQTDAVNSSFPSQVDRLLEKDDRLLDGLQKLLPKVSDTSTDSEEPATVEQLCSALALVSVKEIQARLDRAYREGVADYGIQQNGTISKDLTDQQRKQRATLRAELEELSGEVDGLVGIVIDHQYRKPLHRSQSSALAESQTQRVKWSEYTVSALVYLTSRLDTINDHVERLHGHGAALRALSTILDDVVTIVQPAKQVSATAAPLQTPERASIRGLKPLRLVQANLSDGQDPAIQFLRQHEVRIADLDNLPKLLDTLATTSRDRNARWSNLTRSIEHSTSEAAAQSMAQADAETNKLLRAVYAHSAFGRVKLVDPHVQASMDSLESDTQRIGDQMRELDSTAISRTIAAKRAEALEKLTDGHR